MKAQSLHSSHFQKERGAVLVISLIFLLVMTLIGLTGMKTSVLEEKMAGNSRNQDLAFQAAETSLHGAEQYLEAIVTASDFGEDVAANGLVSEASDDPDYLDPSIWVDASSVEYSSGSSGLSVIGSAPRFIIKLVGESEDDENTGLNIGGYGENLPGAQITIFRVTSRGTGGTDNARVTLQTYFGKRF
ncbi:MAG: hypothetical protein DRR42_19740 [Gammaproteobacteria bacterium]|nr:MAG: hypothetical protein DRR42_19740 [Gammaproteobacteria bacterium]